MSDKEKLPAKPATHAVAAPVGPRGSLVARALADLQDSTERALVSKSQDLRYQQARSAYERQLANSGKTAWTAEETAALVAAFKTLRELAVEGYGKAYFPLATFYSSGWCIEKDVQQAKRFFALAFEWCQANQAKQDAELWFDLAAYLNGGINKHARQPHSMLAYLGCSNRRKRRFHALFARDCVMQFKSCAPMEKKPNTYKADRMWPRKLPGLSDNSFGAPLLTFFEQVNW